ncbi:50S ribosome-binding GTPase [Thermosynechococcaceae cyanobacterium Okahandja]
MVMISVVKASVKNLPRYLQPLSRWFQVDAAALAEVLATARQQLPVTEVLLIGKPQSGKSSIVRAITGAAASIVGSGFRPHTSQTQRYDYPTAELPLLTFTDTVGLGETPAQTEQVVAELDQLLRQSQRARVIILTLKVTDFASDRLHHVAKELKRQHPEIPFLVAVTCLHELYPPSQENHPPYPPDMADLNLAIAGLRERFADISDRLIPIDFTLEEDGYTPLFYGFDALAATLETVLPHAEANMLRQLVAQSDLSHQIAPLYRQVGRRYIAPFAVMAATLSAVPFPFATMPVLVAVQVVMVILLGQLYGQTLSPSQAGGILTTIGGGFVARLIGQQMIKFIPGFGAVLAASWAAAYTWALGEAACVYFGDLMGGKTPDPDRIQQVLQETLAAAKLNLPKP